MVDYRTLISTSKPSDHQANMANSLASAGQSAHPKQTQQLQRCKKQAKQSNSLMMPPCEGSRSAAVDIVILIAVLGSIGFLVFPCIKLLFSGVTEIAGLTISAVKEEVDQAPLVYAYLVGISFLFAAIAVWGIFHFTARKCDNPNCRGLRKAAEFDIQLETEEHVKNLCSQSDVGKGLFELAEAHHKELEAELKKMAPSNGRAVLVFRARCGCSVGRMEVWGPKKLKKIKK